jgi:protein-disulfide isomerase
VPWELIGVLVVAGVFAVGAVFWFASPRGRGELQPPTALTLEAAPGLQQGMTVDGHPYLGAPDAPVVVREIADFQCPYCRQFALQDFSSFAAKQVADGEVQWVWMAVGFDGRESVASAVAALCAARQGRFWAMHDWLYANASPVVNGGAFSGERLAAMARSAGLDGAEFDACLQDPSVEQLVRDNEAYARKLGVNATPTFVVGERLVEGLDLASLRALIDAAAKD